jgi:hypothetical protein
MSRFTSPSNSCGRYANISRSGTLSSTDNCVAHDHELNSWRLESQIYKAMWRVEEISYAHVLVYTDALQACERTFMIFQHAQARHTVQHRHLHSTQQ